MVAVVVAVVVVVIAFVAVVVVVAEQNCQLVYRLKAQKNAHGARYCRFYKWLLRCFFLLHFYRGLFFLVVV